MTGPAHAAPVAGTRTDDELARIARDYPAWHVWRSQAGRWWATRLRHARPPADRDQQDPAFVTTLDADTSAELRAALADQLHRFS